MTRDEADQECIQRNSEVPDDQSGVHWLVREASPGDWHVARVVIPGARPRVPLKTTIEAHPQGIEPPDPRPAHNPIWGTGF